MSTAPSDSAAALDAAADRLLNRIGHWTPQRWRNPIRDGGIARGDCVYALVQQLADAAAEAERRPVRPVPRLDNDLALPDQFRVMVSDLRRHAPEPVLQFAATLVDATARLL